MLSHSNVLATVVAMHAYVRESKLEYSDEDNILSYLTLAHILGRVCEEFAISTGAHIGYWQVASLPNILLPLIPLPSESVYRMAGCRRASSVGEAEF